MQCPLFCHFSLANCVRMPMSEQCFPILFTLWHMSVKQRIWDAYKQSRIYNASTYDFLTLQWCKSDTYSVDSYCEFWSFHGLEICGLILSYDAGQQQRATPPGQPCNHEGQPPIHWQPLCTHTTTLGFFWYSTVFNKCHEIVTALL